MKKSRVVTLVLSGGLLAACHDNGPGLQADNGWGDDGTSTNSVVYTNNTYHPAHGYWHAPYRAWFPYPYNYYIPNRGYYHGGVFTSTPHQSSVRASSPGRTSSSSRVSRGGFGFSSHSTAS